MTEHFAEINGVRIHYEDEGEGPAVVWLHGLMGSIARGKAMGEAIDGLAERGYRVVTYDARGHGESGYTEDESHYTWEAHARDMAALMDHLGIKRAAVGGGSMGAGVSLIFALAHPERVEKLVLVALPGFDGEIELAKQLFGGFATLIATMGLEQATEIAMQLPPLLELKERAPTEYEATRQWFLALDPKATVFAIRGLLNGPALPGERLAEVRAPTLVIGHPDDPVHPAASAEKAHSAIAGSRLIMGTDVSYFRNHRDEMIEAVASFLAQ